MFFNRRFLTSTSGSCLRRALIAADRLMLLSLRDRSSLARGGGFGRLGHRCAASFSFGSLSISAVGQLIASPPLCDQAEETIQHILVGCVFLRQIWASILRSLNFASLAPLAADTRFFTWWARYISLTPKEARKGLNTLFILVAWEIWKHRNACVFEGKRPCVQTVLREVASECNLWVLAGASALRELLTRQLLTRD